MDIENMHPFCLPFSLCHDATSSSITESLYDIKHDKQNDGEKFDGKEEKSGLGSTMDEQSSLTPQRLIADEDHLLESSLGGSSHDAFDLLDLDMEMRTDTIFELNDIDNDDICNKEDDWFSSHECSLFSTLNDITSDHHSSRSSLRPCLKGPSSISTLAHNHQVFQHIVDPIDIKSSPTLAQLNLNSNDDPTDGLWGSSGATATTSTNSTLISSTAHHHHHHHHLNSSSTNSDLMSSAPSCNSSTETNSLMMGCSRGNFPSSCNHTNSYNHQSNIQAKDTHSHLNNLHTCQHHPYHHTQRYPQQSNTDTQSSQSHSHSTCLAVAPFRKEAHQVQRGGTSAHTGCCLNHCQHLERFNTSSPSAPAQSSNCMTDKKSHCFQHHNCHRDQELSLGKSQTLTGADKNSNQVQRSLQQRSQSPAPLVTSSSSPLSSSATLNPGLENRQLGGENKLKENIEYLTVLLCNGSKKIDEKVIQKQTSQDQQQQSSISSSMVKSYSTLAQSLSSEPKLLGSYNQSKQLVHNGSYIQSNHNNNLPNTAVNQTNSSHETHQCAVQSDGHLRNGLKLTCPNHCFKQANVESSISAADSTAENQLRPNHPGLSPCYVSQNGQALTNSAQMQISRAGEMKVLSSLLSSNKCIPQGPADLMMNAPFTSKDGYNQAPCVTWTAPCGQSMNQTMHQVPAGYNSGMYQSESSVNRTGTTYNQHDNSSIPVNGRPITLTPLVSNNVSIPQRQQAASQPQNAKVKTSTFVQPASPSTSSTTSSSGNTEISPSFALTKKQKSAASGKGNSQSVRSGRPSSMSTDCSLSSHDEGFSSQIDQDDCANSVRDSDDESDIDSDDESFYGDYTNNDLIGASISDNPECKWTLNMGRTRRNGQRRFFWQYNVQSKGPKGTRICPADGAEDPFVLPEASDPVFSNECQVEGVKHSGKARRGDGNDLTPNPRKLLMIGLELKKLSKIINDLAPVTDLPINARNKTRKEKNKLASRACRLKKKAQHEANKIKLYGLQREHQQIVMAIFDARKMIHKALTQQRPVVDPNDTVLSTNLKRLLEQCLMTVAGQTSDYVNSVLEKVVSGCIDGGLQT